MGDGLNGSMALLVDDHEHEDEQRTGPIGPSITVDDVLYTFPGARVVEKPIDEPKPLCCKHCDKDSVPLWRRGGKIVRRVESDDTRVWACHFCGQQSKTKRTSTRARP
jgi:hypothetical protein